MQRGSVERTHVQGPALPITSRVILELTKHLSEPQEVGVRDVIFQPNRAVVGSEEMLCGAPGRAEEKPELGEVDNASVCQGASNLTSAARHSWSRRRGAPRGFRKGTGQNL